MKREEGEGEVNMVLDFRKPLIFHIFKRLIISIFVQNQKEICVQVPNIKFTKYKT
jgi:hypothetical protein